ncbi:MAG TPA: hypothetical protein VF384_08545 [Planctomycetota bacterium]
MREHVLFQAPHAIDVRATVDVETPKQWRDKLGGAEKVSVVRLCDDKGPKMPGWCALAGGLQGPEIEVMCGGINTKQPTAAGVWRQGHLLHFGFEPSPGEFNETGRKLLLNAIDYIARFVTDRPIVRVNSFTPPEQMTAPKHWLEFMMTFAKATTEDLAGMFAEPWKAQIGVLELAEARAFIEQRRPALCVEGRKFLFDEDALALGVDVAKAGVLRQLVDLLRGEQQERAMRLLARLLPDGPGAGTTPNNWGYWLKPREDALCFDVHFRIWRLDPLAFWRGAKSAELLGPARADGDAHRDPAAAELAAKVVAHHGGERALDDLKTFACRFGEIRCCWDREHGLFRLENSGTIPKGNRATAWKVAIFDAAADADVLRGGGPEPKPFVSGRGWFRELQERLFLPLRLLEPGTSLRLLPDDADGRRCLEVRLAGRCADQRKAYVLHVDPRSGALHAIDEMPREGRPGTWSIEGTIQVGPLTLPAKFVRKTASGADVDEYVEAAWNPKLPDGIEASKEMLLGVK